MDADVIISALVAFKATFEQLDDLEAPEMWPESPNVPCVITRVETIDWDFTNPSTFVSHFLVGATDSDAAQRLLLRSVGDAVLAIDNDNTLAGAVSSVIPLEMRNFAPGQAQEGRTRVWEAEQVWSVLLAP